jgi:small subunit ribosomal protein S9
VSVCALSAANSYSAQKEMARSMLVSSLLLRPVARRGLLAPRSGTAGGRGGGSSGSIASGGISLPVRCVSGIRAQAEWMDVDPGPFKDAYKEYVPPVRKRVVDEQGFASGAGRKKTASASVKVKEGSGRFFVNGMPLHKVIKPYLRVEIMQVMLNTKTAGILDVYCTVQGGGFASWAWAIRSGLAYAIQNFDPAYRAILKPSTEY